MSIRFQSSALAALFFCSPLLIASPAPRGDIDPEPLTKCCKPASVAPPAAGCTTSCRPTITCGIGGTRPGTIVNGVCQNTGEECVLTPGLEAGKPLFMCTSVECTLPDGGTGAKCIWAFFGEDPNSNVTFTDCSGTPCS